MNADITKERSKASFDVQQLTYLLDGGQKNTERRRYLESLVSTEPVFEKENVFFQDRNEGYESSLKKGVRFLQLCREHKITKTLDKHSLTKMIDCPLPFHLHNMMFVPTIKILGTQEQQAEWLPLAESHEILGTYAQTEMGHGTFVRGIETTATYDKTTQEFELHSPTLTAAKWWPGALGHSCTHAIVPAQLVIDGQSYGIQFFILQFRDVDTRHPLAGIRVGDIGPKPCTIVNFFDNGYLLLDHVRIPRDQMLMALAKVSPDGVFSRTDQSQAGEKMLYATMMFVRAVIPSDMFEIASQAITIAIRYSAIRKQGELKARTGELQILEYKTQQEKLLPGLAMAYAFKFTADHVLREYEQSSEMWKAGDYSNLQELHILTSAMKAFTTSGTRVLCDLCRLACGGHGYSSFSMLPDMYSLSSASCTYEGDATVLYLQVARYLLKCISRVHDGALLPFSVSYLDGNRTSTGTTSPSVSAERQFLDPEIQLQLYRERSYRLIKSVAGKMESSIMSGMEPHVAWNENSPDLVRSAMAHSSYLVVKVFTEALNTSLAGYSKEITTVLKCLSDLYSLYGIIQHSGSFLETGVLTTDHLPQIRRHISNLYKVLRPDAVALVDAFDNSDFVLNSALGRYDGQVYQRLFQLAQKSRLNRHLVHPAAEKHLKELLMSKL